MNAREVEQLLASIGESCLQEPERIAGGMSGTQVWRVELTRGPQAFRVFPIRHESDAALEQYVLDLAGRSGLPVARVWSRNSIGRWSCLLVEWLPGEDLGAILLSRPERAAGFGMQFGLLQANLHGIEAPRSLPPALDWPASEAYPSGLRSLLAASAAAGGRLLHLDYHPANVVAKDGDISGILDWTNVRRGDPRFDVARTYLLLRFLPGLDAATKARYRPILANFRQGWREGYRTGAEPINGLAPYLAWAGYGLRYDMGRKPEGSMSAASRHELQAAFRLLDRWIGRWMGAAGL